MNIKLPSSLVTLLVTGFRPLKLAKSSLPILKCLCLAVSPSKLTVTGSTLDEALIYTGEIANDQTTSLLVPFDLLNEASKQADGELTLADDTGSWTLSCVAGGSKITHLLPTLAVADYPAVPEFPAEGQPTPAGFIRSLVEAQSAASTDSTRYILNSVFVTPTHVVATNGRQLYASNSLALTLPESGIIFRTSDCWKVFAADKATELLLRGGDVPTHVALRQGPWQWVSSLIAGQYPNWKQVVPTVDNTGTAIVFSEEDATRLQRVLPKLPGNKEEHSPVRLRVKDGFAGMQVGKPGAEVTIDLPTTTTQGGAVACKFNRGFLVTALAQGFRELRIRDGVTPLLMRSGPRTHLWMPVRDDTSTPAASAPASPATPAAPAAVPVPVSETQPINDSSQPMPSTFNTRPKAETPAPVNRLATAGTPPPASLDVALEQLGQTREVLRTLTGSLAQLVTTLKDVARDHKSLEREHEGLRKSIRALRTVEV